MGIYPMGSFSFENSQNFATLNESQKSCLTWGNDGSVFYYRGGTNWQARY